MEHLPIFMNLQGRPVLVVGAGPIAARKAALLLATGAQVTMLAPECGRAARALLVEYPETLRWVEGCYHPRRLDGMTLVIAATDQPGVNERVASDADARAIPVNVADRPELCRFILPAIVERGPLTIAIGSGGRAPVLVRRLRARLESLIPVGYGWLAELAGRLRERVQAQLPDLAQRRAFWEQAFEGPAARLALNGALGAAEARLCADLDAFAARAQGSMPGAQRQRMGAVYLIGAGPGDPELLTFKALRLLQQADVIVHDRLVAREVIDLGRREAERICVGKQRARHAMPQGEINALLVDLACEGKIVARLKGGDPFVFGRGGEELDALMAAGIPAEVVPGVTAATGCAAYAGIPLTHRDHADRVRILTGQTCNGRFSLAGPGGAVLGDLGTPEAARETLVIYMGLAALADIAVELAAHGLAVSTPVAVVSHGTTPRQRVVRGRLDDIARQVDAAGVESPALIIVGAVAALADRLGWFHPDPGLAGVCQFPQRLASPTEGVATDSDVGIPAMA